MPGVEVLTRTRTGGGTDQEAPASTFFVAGLTERGRTDKAYLAHSLPEFEGEFGEWVAYGYVHDAVRTFFSEGGTRVYVIRVVGAGASTGSLTLQDRDATTPQDTLRLTALGPGAWSGDVTVAVEDGTVAGTFRLVVEYGGDSEVYDNLESPADAAAKVNRRSQWVVATDLGSTNAAPDNNPALLAATPLSTGDDDRASVVAADYVAALDARATEDLGAGAVAIPGQPAGTIGDDLVVHARDRRRIALLASTETATSAQAISDSQALRGSSGSEHAGLFYPWVQVRDPGAPGGVRNTPPEGYVAAVRARAHLREGPWRAPAGKLASAEYVVDVVTELTESQGNDLDAAEVSVIRVINDDVRLYGWRSLSDDEENYALLTGREVLNYLATEGERRLEDYVFRTIDSRGHLFGEIHAEMLGLVQPMAAAGGLYAATNEAGEQVDPGYSVDTGPTVNTAQTLQNNEARVAVAARVSPSGALITLIITKAGFTATL